MQHYIPNIFVVSNLGNMTALIMGALVIKLAALVMSVIVDAIALFFLYSVFEMIQIIINTKS